MIKYSSMIDKPIFSVKEGRQWGRISAVYLNSKKFTVTGFGIEKLEKFLPIEKVTTFGESSVVFPGGDDLNACKESVKGKSVMNAEKIKGKRVITKKGKEVGYIEMFYFDDETGRITHYEISENPFSAKKLLSQDGVVLLGPDAFIVTDTAALISEKMKSKDELRGLLGKFSKKAKEFSGRFSEKIKGYREGTEKQMIELKKNAEKSAGEIKEKAGELSRKDNKKAGKKTKAPAKKKQRKR